MYPEETKEHSKGRQPLTEQTLWWGGEYTEASGKILIGFKKARTSPLFTPLPLFVTSISLNSCSFHTGKEHLLSDPDLHALLFYCACTRRGRVSSSSL